MRTDLQSLQTAVTDNCYRHLVQITMTDEYHVLLL